MDHYMIRQELNPETCRLEIKRVAGTSPGVPGDILGSYEELRWMEPHMSSPSPCTRFKKGRGQKEEKREVLHLFRCYTHTHPARAGSTLKGKRKKKRTHEGQKAKNSAGGEGNRRTSGTNLHGETDLTKTAHAPKPHDTLRRSTRGN